MDAGEYQVVVVGGGITGLACAHRLLRSGLDVLVLESGDRAGGKVETLQEAGYQFETGPNTLMSSRPELPELIAELGLDGQVVHASPRARRRYIAMDGALLPLPTSPVAMLRSPLLGARGLLRAAADLKRSRVAPPASESVADFVRRRFGARVLDNLVAPFLTGVYAGDAERLEAASVLKQLAEAERKHGSVVRGMIAERKAAKVGRNRERAKSITFRDGLDLLPRELAKALEGRLRTGASVVSLQEEAGGVAVGMKGGERIRAERVVLASSTRTMASLLRQVEGGEAVAEDLGQVRMASLAVVGLGFDRSEVPHELDGFGYLAGPGTPGPVLGCLFRSAVFPHTAPAGETLLTAFVGGVRFPGAAEWSDGQLIAAVRAQLGSLLGVRASPGQVFVRRWKNSIPQYEVGHAARARRIQSWCASRPISVVGSAVTGVSIPDCIGAARAEADRIVAGLSRVRREELCASA